MPDARAGKYAFRALFIDRMSNLGISMNCFVQSGGLRSRLPYPGIVVVFDILIVVVALSNFVRSRLPVKKNERSDMILIIIPGDRGKLGNFDKTL